MLEFEEDARREYYGLEPSRPADLKPLHALNVGNGHPGMEYFCDEEARARFQALVTPEWRGRFGPQTSKKRKHDDNGRHPSWSVEQVPQKLQGGLLGYIRGESVEPSDRIDPDDPVFTKGPASPPLALLKKLAAMDAKAEAPRPRVFVQEGPGTAKTSYSYYDGKLYLDTHTRDSAKVIKGRLKRGLRAKRSYMVAQLHLWGCSAAGKSGRSLAELHAELEHSVNVGWVSTPPCLLFFAHCVLV
jgi:hypothetical protein